ncbi:MAG: hypothetical protein PWP51_1389 [Clostridiales bacterium]|jgi:transcriptional regulator with PAS, ATPase and Fis domain|nr:hypothetical protein [Clostridiales bacterium]MDN5298836.1 hypothetical protein [Clostridiales bacterium]
MSKNKLSFEIMQEFINQLDGMAVLDKEGYYTYVSPGWERYTGFRASEVLGRKVWEIIPESHATEVFQTGKTVTRGLVSFNGIPAFTTYFPRFDQHGDLCGIMLYIVIQGKESVAQFQARIIALSSQIEFYRKELSLERGAKYSLDNIIGESKPILDLKHKILQASRSSSTVLIEGETGSGKELIAHAIHTLSSRCSANFVRVNCSAIPNELMESEFFGYAAGAFTGASRKGKIGRFELADKGTLFLDEINLLPTTMQPKFLRALQEHEIDPVGSLKSQFVDVRVIAASNIELEQLVEKGSFRSDLYYRLNVIRIAAPPLRTRKEDIPLLVQAFISRLNKQLGMMVGDIGSEALNFLMAYDWPGNVRELQNAVESAMNQTDSTILTIKDFSQLTERIRMRERKQAVTHYKLIPAKQAFEKSLIQDALMTCEGNRKRAAELLGISRTMLYNKMAQYEIGDS